MFQQKLRFGTFLALPSRQVVALATKSCFHFPFFPHGSGAGRAWRQEHVHESITDPGKTKPKAFTPDSEVEDCRDTGSVQFEPILVTPSQTERQCHQ